MLTILLVIQAIVAVAMITVILLQRSNADGLSGLSGSSGGRSLVSSRTSANIMTRTTAILAAVFMLNCLAMGIIASRNSKTGFNFEETHLPGTKPTKNSISEDKNSKESPENEESPAVPLAQ